MARTVADVIVEAVHGARADHVFGVAGDALNPVTDAVRRRDSVSGVGCRHEEVGAFAAGAQAQLDGRLGVCAATVGPEGLHLELEQEQAGLPEFGTKLDNPDLAAVAGAMGATGFRVEEPRRLGTVLAEALEHPVPVVVDVLTNSHEVALAPELTASDLWGFSIAKLKEAITSGGDASGGTA